MRVACSEVAAAPFLLLPRVRDDDWIAAAPSCSRASSCGENENGAGGGAGTAGTASDSDQSAGGCAGVRGGAGER